MEVKAEKGFSLFHKNGKIFWSSNVLTNVMYFFEPKELVKGPFMLVNKNMNKATNNVITVWRYEGTNLIEKTMLMIEARKKDFLESGRRRAWKDASEQLSVIRMEALKKSKAIPLPK